MFKPLTEQNLEEAMCIILCTAVDEPVVSKQETQHRIGYHDWFFKVPQIITDFPHEREIELIFDANYCSRARFYIYHAREARDPALLTGAEYFFYVSHMNHGTSNVQVPRVFKNIEDRLIAANFPVERESRA